MPQTPPQESERVLGRALAALESTFMTVGALEAGLKPVCANAEIDDLLEDLHQALARLDRSLIQAARSLEESPWRRPSPQPAGPSHIPAEAPPRQSADAVAGRRAPSPHGNPLRVLVVEDEYLIATEIVAALAAGGHDVIGPCATLAAAQIAVASNLPRIDAAVLDMNLSGEPIWPVAETLRQNGVPILFASGYSRVIEPPQKLRAAPRLSKPIDAPALLRAVAELA